MNAATKLENLAVKIGTALGKADRTAHKISQTIEVVEDELLQLRAQIEIFADRLKKGEERLKRTIG